MQLLEHLSATPDRAIVWQDTRLCLLDQRRLPQQELYLALDTATEVATAIREMVVRGAPAIGISAAYGVALAGRQAWITAGSAWIQGIEIDLNCLAQARPTAVNLFWALAHMREIAQRLPITADPFPALLQAAQALHQADIAANRRMGELGAALLTTPTAVITHCNAGALATGGYGTALGVIRAAHAAGNIRQVFADETRPWLQGARLTAWELHRDGIPVTLLVEGAAASRMALGEISWVIVGADRIAANGDVANKIGTYPLAIAAHYHGVKVMVVAPTSTIDMQIANSAAIPIETRAATEILYCGEQLIAAPGVDAWNPVFDVTPAALVAALVTERGVILKPDRIQLAALMANA